MHGWQIPLGDAEILRGFTRQLNEGSTDSLSATPVSNKAQVPAMLQFGAFFFYLFTFLCFDLLNVKLLKSICIYLFKFSSSIAQFLMLDILSVLFDKPKISWSEREVLDICLREPIGEIYKKQGCQGFVKGTFQTLKDGEALP